MMLGGRAAEALILGDITTGASNDIERATNLARGMVVKYGMSDVIGPVFHGAQQEVFLGKELVQSKACSEEAVSYTHLEKTLFLKILKHTLRSFPFPTIFSGRKSPL